MGPPCGRRKGVVNQGLRPRFPRLNGHLRTSKRSCGQQRLPHFLKRIRQIFSCSNTDSKFLSTPPCQVEVPQQDDGFSCGVYSIIYGRGVTKLLASPSSKSLKFLNFTQYFSNITPEKVNQYREKLYEAFQNQINGDDDDLGLESDSDDDDDDDDELQGLDDDDDDDDDRSSSIGSSIGSSTGSDSGDSLDKDSLEIRSTDSDNSEDENWDDDLNDDDLNDDDFSTLSSLLEKLDKGKLKRKQTFSATSARRKAETLLKQSVRRRRSRRASSTDKRFKHSCQANAKAVRISRMAYVAMVNKVVKLSEDLLGSKVTVVIEEKFSRRPVLGRAQSAKKKKLAGKSKLVRVIAVDDGKVKTDHATLEKSRTMLLGQLDGICELVKQDTTGIVFVTPPKVKRKTSTPKLKRKREVDSLKPWNFDRRTKMK